MLNWVFTGFLQLEEEYWDSGSFWDFFLDLFVLPNLVGAYYLHLLRRMCHIFT